MFIASKQLNFRIVFYSVAFDFKWDMSYDNY